MKLTDAQAKAVLLKWPGRTKIWHTEAGQYWLRAQPKNGGGATPRLQTPGALMFRTQPDGMWVFLGRDGAWADIVAVEVCGSKQNLNDKRARYAGLSRSMILLCPIDWLRSDCALPRNGRKPRWQACGSFDGEPEAQLMLPVRFLTVLFALPDSLLLQWRTSGVGAPGEYYCSHGALKTYNSQSFQKFLKQMSFAAHYR